MPSLGLWFQAWKSVLFASFSVLRHGSVLTPKMSRQQAASFFASNFNYCRFSSQIACVLALLGGLFAGLNFACDFTFISVWKWLCICIFFFTALEVKRWHSEICQLPKYLFFIWIWVAGMPTTTNRRFSPVAGAYGDHWICLFWIERLNHTANPHSKKEKSENGLNCYDVPVNTDHSTHYSATMINISIFISFTFSYTISLS